MQRIYKKAREVYPDWNPLHGPQVVSGLSEMTKFVDTLEEVYPNAKWIPIDDIGSDPTFRNDLCTIIIASDFKPKETIRIFSMTIGNLFFKPNETLPSTGSYFLPQIVPVRSFQLTRSIIQTFDVDKLIDMKHGDPAIIPEDMIGVTVHVDKENWKKLVKEKYFSDVEAQIDQMLDGIYECEAYPPTEPTAELLGRIMIRVHKDDFDAVSFGGTSEYFTSDDAKGEAYIERVMKENKTT